MSDSCTDKKKMSDSCFGFYPESDHNNTGRVKVV